MDLFPVAPCRPASRHYRRWPFESAALDLGLRQAGLSLADVLGRTPRPVRFVSSVRLGEPPSVDPIRARLQNDPMLEFKLDPTLSWNAKTLREIAATCRVRIVAAAVAAERARISVELHDIIAHSVSAMVVQAGSARLLLRSDPERARASLSAIERTGRDTLTDLRSLLGMLRRQAAP